MEIQVPPNGSAVGKAIYQLDLPADTWSFGGAR